MKCTFISVDLSHHWCFKWLNTHTYRHISLTNFVIRQSRSFESICVSLHLTNCLFLVPAATEHFQFSLYGSGTVFHSISHLLRHFPSSAVTWRHTSSNSVTRNHWCRVCEM